MPSYDWERSLTDLKELADLTGGPEGARRLAWSEDWRTAREGLLEKLEGTDRPGERGGGPGGGARPRLERGLAHRARVAAEEARGDRRVGRAGRRREPVGDGPGREREGHRGRLAHRRGAERRLARRLPRRLRRARGP